MAGPDDPHAEAAGTRQSLPANGVWGEAPRERAREAEPRLADRYLPRKLQPQVAVVAGVVEPFGGDLDVEEEVDAALQERQGFWEFRNLAIDTGKFLRH